LQQTGTNLDVVAAFCQINGNGLEGRVTHGSSLEPLGPGDATAIKAC
jgi:hypothetical protein